MYPNFRDIKSRGEERTLEPLSQFCSLSQVWSAPGTHIIRRTPNSIWAGRLLSGKVKEAVLKSKGLHSASVFSNFISMLFYWGKKTEIIKFTSEGHCEDGRRLGMGSAKNTLRDICYISALLSSFCVLCFLASPPSKKPEQAITHPETFLKLSMVAFATALLILVSSSLAWCKKNIF